MKEKFEFLSTDGKTVLQGYKWIPDGGAVKAVVQITHGMQEFIDRYEGFAAYLAEHGYLTAGYDQLGHGASAETPEDWGYIGKDPCSLLLGDMHRARELLRGEYPEIPYFMLGHSMGSYELRCYIAEHGDGLAGAAIVGTGFVPGKDTKKARRVVKAMAAVRGWRFRSRMLQKMTFAGPYRQFDLTGENPENSWLTGDSEIVRHYYSDPRCTFLFTLNGYLGLFDAVSGSCNLESVQRVSAELPVLIASGEDDPVGDMGDGVLQVYRMFRDHGMKDLTCHIYDGDRHEILNETDRDKVWADFLCWFDRHC